MNYYLRIQVLVVLTAAWDYSGNHLGYYVDYPGQNAVHCHYFPDAGNKLLSRPMTRQDRADPGVLHRCLLDDSGRLGYGIPA